MTSSVRAAPRRTCTAIFLSRSVMWLRHLLMTGKLYSAKPTPSSDQLGELRKTRGQTLEQWWRNYFGHAFDRLTQSEARYLSRSPDADRIRERIIEAKRPRDFQGHYRGPKAQRQRLNQPGVEPKPHLSDGVPHSQRPTAGHWQGYGESEPAGVTEPSPNHFDLNRIVLRLLASASRYLPHPD